LVRNLNLLSKAYINLLHKYISINNLLKNDALCFEYDLFFVSFMVLKLTLRGIFKKLE